MDYITAFFSGAAEGFGRSVKAIKWLIIGLGILFGLLLLRDLIQLFDDE